MTETKKITKDASVGVMIFKTKPNNHEFYNTLRDFAQEHDDIVLMFAADKETNDYMFPAYHEHFGDFTKDLHARVHIIRLDDETVESYPEDKHLFEIIGDQLSKADIFETEMENGQEVLYVHWDGFLPDGGWKFLNRLIASLN